MPAAKSDLNNKLKESPLNGLSGGDQTTPTQSVPSGNDQVKSSPLNNLDDNTSQTVNNTQNKTQQTVQPEKTNNQENSVNAGEENKNDQTKEQPEASINNQNSQTGVTNNSTSSGTSNQQGEIVPDLSDKKNQEDPSIEGIINVNLKGKTVGEILHERGKITDEQLKEVKYAVANKQGKEDTIIANKNWTVEEEIVKAKAASYGMPFVDLSVIDIPRDVITKVPFESAKSHGAVLFKEDSNTAHVGMIDPLDIQRVRFIQGIVRKSVKTYFASSSAINMTLDTKYAGQMESEVTEAVGEVANDVVTISEGVEDISEVESTISSAPVARIVNMILEYGIKYKASDIHIEPHEKRLGVRFRINGVMTEKLNLPKRLVSSVVARIKILSDLKIDEHRIPQDGRFQVRAGEKEVDLRVSVMPTVHGEKVVIRLLEKGQGLLKLEETGMRGVGYKLYKESLESTQGVILVTGPTGSGKTQTLASSLLILNQPNVNIVTLEDPVEIKVDGVNQIQINKSVGLSFSSGLRSILRQDPDIIMVGEIRDEETAGLAVQASLTGHLVLATLHTSSAAGALPRLLDMHIEPYLLTSTINVIVAQRLVRRICEKCKEQYVAPPETVKMIHKVMNGLQGFDMYSYPKRDNKNTPPGQVPVGNNNEIPPAEAVKQHANTQDQKLILYRGRGCSHCNNTGYGGRVGVFEVLKVSEKISQLIMEHRNASTIEKQAVEEGLVTMLQDGFMKALEGITTVEEVLRVQKK